jgi:SAM-dependent methyltransferase
VGGTGEEILTEDILPAALVWPGGLIGWSHRRRFATGVALAGAFHGRRVLDYGCGDGTFLAMLSESAHPPADSVGAELYDHKVSDCRTRLGRQPGLSFTSVDSLDLNVHRERYDGVVCMEVLEHVVDVDAVIDRLWRLLAADGTLLVSVPVETGLPLLIKQAVRRIAGWRRIGQYPGTSPYTWRECVVSLFAGSTPHLVRTTYGCDAHCHDHKGFNWMALRDRLARRFTIDRIVASPLAWLGPHFATQVWFVARKTRSGDGSHL